jgi:hypothetical protein
LVAWAWTSPRVRRRGQERNESSQWGDDSWRRLTIADRWTYYSHDGRSCGSVGKPPCRAGHRRRVRTKSRCGRSGDGGGGGGDSAASGSGPRRLHTTAARRRPHPTARGGSGVGTMTLPREARKGSDYDGDACAPRRAHHRELGANQPPSADAECRLQV